MPTVYITVGPPGAGKTTFVSWKLVGSGKVGANYVLNPDGLLFAGDRYQWSPERAGRAWRGVKADFLRLLERGKDIAVDAVFARRRDRKPFLDAAKQSSYRVVVIYFDVSPEILVWRDGRREDRGKKVGVDVVRRFADAVEPPKTDEGIDEVWTVGPDGEVSHE